MKRELTYATVCSGIECMSVACIGLPMRPVFFSEIEPFPCAVLKAHYPDVPNLGDMSKIQVSDDGKEITNGTTTIRLHERLGILAGGTPCQDVSVAGKRAGMQAGSGTRSSLAFDFVRLARELGPRWVLWENVAAVIDSKNAPDFLAFLRALGECGYSLAWRVLDAQYVRVDGMERAVPQRRRRVWVVGRLGADESVPAQILFEPDCVAGNTAPRRRTGQGFAYTLAGRDRVDAGLVGSAPGIDVLNFQGSKGNNCVTDDGSCPNLNAMHGHDVHVVAVRTANTHANGHGVADEATHTIDGANGQGVAYETKVYENHAQDSRVQGPIDTAPTQGSSTANSAGVTGNNPLVCFSKVSHPTAPNGEGERWDEREVAQTRNTFDNGEKRCQEVVVSMAQNTRDEVRIVGGDGQIAGALPAEPGMKQQTYIVSTAYKLDSTASNSMKSANPHSGFHETDVAACLDTTTPDPSKGQGGNVIISTNSNGEDVAPTISQSEYRIGQNQKDTGEVCDYPNGEGRSRR